jgi:hypothetical protein
VAAIQMYFKGEIKKVQEMLFEKVRLSSSWTMILVNESQFSRRLFSVPSSEKSIMKTFFVFSIFPEVSCRSDNPNSNSTSEVMKF